MAERYPEEIKMLGHSYLSAGFIPMFLTIHQPFYGYLTVESDPIECAGCGKNNWRDIDLTTCPPGTELECLNCGRKSWINWGLTEPEHLSTWLSSEKCPHHICQVRYAGLVREKGWDDQPAVHRDAPFIDYLRQQSQESRARIRKMKEDWDSRPLWQKFIWWVRMKLLGIEFYLRGWETVPEDED